MARCARCGTRSAPGALERTMVFTCETCGLPFLAREILSHAEQRCPDCRAGSLPAGLPDAAVAVAAEAEIRGAIEDRWNLVTSPSLTPYLDRIARMVAARVENAPIASRVVLVDEPGIMSLALPSGTLLLTLGAVGFLEDEAELVFVLGHEIAHAASEDAAVRLVRLGFRAVSRGGPAPDREAWAGAALDLVRLGYGRRRERDADLRALEAVLSLGYDPRSALRHLDRLQSRIEAGDPAVAELANSHPPPEDRIRRIEKALFGRVSGEAVLRVNREVFRRAAGSEVLAGPMIPLSLGEVAEEPAVAAPGKRRLWPWVALGLLAAAAVAAAIAFLVGS